MSATTTTGRVARTGVHEVVLDDREIASALECVDGLCAAGFEATGADLLETAWALGRSLPERVFELTRALKYREQAPVALIKGFPIDDAQIGPTPAHWREPKRGVTARPDLWLVLVSAQLGDLICWKSIQDGRIVNDIHPIVSQRDHQTGHSSEVLLDLHVEDAFHELRCDNLGLLCLRNPHGTATTVAGIDAVDLGSAEFDVLFEPRFLIEADDEHKRNLAALGLSADDVRPTPAPVLFGSRDCPFVRLDPPYMRAVPGDHRAEQALTTLINLLAQSVTDVVLDPGDLLLIDNHRALHGRRPFPARYDGTDRWLRRATTVRDLSRSRGHRSTATDRAVQPASLGFPRPGHQMIQPVAPE
jgi:L-asparagine oxygenase